MVAIAPKLHGEPTRQDIEKASLSIPHLAETARAFHQWIENESLVPVLVV